MSRCGDNHKNKIGVLHYEEMALLGDVMEWGSGYGYGHDMGCK